MTAALPPDAPSTTTQTDAAPSASWAQFARRHRVFIGTIVLAVVAMLGFDAWVIVQRRRYQAEIARLRASMTELERQRTDQIVAREADKLRLAVALIRRQARLEGSLHLSVALDSGAMLLEREGAMLREMPVLIGPERRVGTAPDTVRLAAPRGVRTVARVLTEGDIWEVPAWVYADRGLEPPADRSIAGALGTAILLEGGAIIYSLPGSGPLSDSTYVLPGAIRARPEDLRSILPNLAGGMRVYLY